MSRILIASSAVQELRALEPVTERRRLVARLSELPGPASSRRISAGGYCRLRSGNLRVLYRCRADGTMVITGIAGAER